MEKFEWKLDMFYFCKMLCNENVQRIKSKLQQKKEAKNM